MTMNYSAGFGADRNWVVEEQSFDERTQGKCEAIMCLGNGYLGSRSATEERYIDQVRNTFIANTFDRFDESEVTELPNCPDVWGMQIFVDGERFTLTRGEVANYSRRLHLRTGELVRVLTWTASTGKHLQLEFRRFVSLANLHLSAAQITLSCSEPAAIRVCTGIDGQQDNSGTQHFIEGEKRVYDKRLLEQVQRTGESGIDVVVAASHRCYRAGEEVEPEQRMRIERRQVFLDLDFELAANETLQIEKFALFRTSADHDVPEDGGLDVLRICALDELRLADSQRYELLQRESRAAWDVFWDDVDVTIDGDDFAQLAVRFAQYHLRCFTPVHDPRCGIAAKGLSGEGYKGHSFWDSEIFCLPFFLYSQPEVARQLLEYRYRTIDGARRKARDNGYRGAMYAWESAATGDEVTPVWGAVDIVSGKATKIWSGFIEQHITADIAYTLWSYYRSTGDDAFMVQMGYEMLFETATFWTSRLEWLDDRQQWGICNVIGPDEYKEHIDNNAFTNYLAEHNIRLAIEYYEKLRSDNPEVVARLAERVPLHQDYEFWCSRVADIYLPQPRPEDGVIPQDDSYLDKKLIDLSPYKAQKHVGQIFQDYNLEQVNGIQVTKQADIMALFLLLRHRFDDELLRANWDYYEPKTLHDSSLSLSSHVLLATQVGDLPLAKSLFERAARIDLGPDMKSSDHGIHGASLGGVWQCVVLGFGGLRVVGQALHIEPRLPEGWDAMEYRFYWQGQRLRVRATTADVEVTGESLLQDVEVVVRGEARTLRAQQEVVVNG